MGAKKCPKLGCDRYISGRECSICGTNPHEEEVVSCVDCGDRVLKKECETETVQDSITAKYSEKNTCHGCL